MAMYNIPGSVTSPAAAGTSPASAGEVGRRPGEGSGARPSPQPSPAGVGEGVEGVRTARTVAEVMAQSQAGDVLDELDRELVGLAPVKARIRDIAALLVIDRLRMNQGLQAQTPKIGRAHV